MSTIINNTNQEFENDETENETEMNGNRNEENGWIKISIWGTAYERGFAYGALCAPEYAEIQTMLNYYVFETTGKEWSYFVNVAKDEFMPALMENFEEFMEEIKGIAEGCVSKNIETSVEEILAWNLYITLIDCWYPTFGNESKSSSSFSLSSAARAEGGVGSIFRRKQGDHCSAFIATGTQYTEDGGIVVGHNSFVEYIDGQYYNVILDLHPSSGIRFIMQTQPCLIWSGTDFFVTENGLIGTETTIGGFFPYEKKIPICFRIRQAMQYGKTLDEYVTILQEGNSGDYANAWLFGDVKSNEIMRFELGLQYSDVQRTNNGYYFGCNFAFDPRIRNLECRDTGYCDVRRHQGARQVRIPDLIESFIPKLNVENAKLILADHYDVYLNKDNNPCSRTCCAHYDLDAREYMSDPSRPKPFAPRGTIDGIVADANMIRATSFMAKYGSSCDTNAFQVSDFVTKHKQWKHLEMYLHDRPIQPWTVCSIFSSFMNSPPLPLISMVSIPQSAITSTPPPILLPLTKEENEYKISPSVSNMPASSPSFLSPSVSNMPASSPQIHETNNDIERIKEEESKKDEDDNFFKELEKEEEMEDDFDNQEMQKEDKREKNKKNDSSLIQKRSKKKKPNLSLQKTLKKYQKKLKSINE